MTATRLADEVAWHDVECGAYAADLDRWLELALSADGPVCELGAGTGRVALALAGAGVAVVAVDTSAALLAELDRRAAAAGLAVESVCADARELELSRRFAAVLAPMQLVHLLGGSGGRGAALRAARSQLAPGGWLAAALVGDDAEVAAAAAAPLLPDVRELDGWIYSSLPIEVAAAGDGFEIRRLRQLVSPDGTLTEQPSSVRLDRVSPEVFEREGRAAGFEPGERIEVPPTADHVGSTICVLGVV